jgi:hypothetical protein
MGGRWSWVGWSRGGVVEWSAVSTSLTAPYRARLLRGFTLEVGKASYAQVNPCLLLKHAF